MSVQVTSIEAYVEVDTTEAVVNIVPVGENGQGVPAGGDQYALLAKASGADYETEWTRQPNVEAVQLDLANGIPPVEGLLTWNIDERTADLGRGNDVVLQLGEELHYPMARNAEATTLGEGELVMVDPSQPAQGQRLRVKRFVSDGTYPSDLFVGMCTEAILPNEIGIITWFGQVRGLNLPTLEPSGETWAEGDILWPNPSVAGGMTNVEPSAPALKITVAAILRISGNNLNVLLRPNLRSKVADLHDVQLTTPTDGQVLRYDSGVWENDTLTASDVGAVALPNYGMLSLTEAGFSIPESELQQAGSIIINGGRPRNTYMPFVITKAINISEALLNVTGGAATAIVNAFIVPAGDDWNPVPSATPLQIMTNINCSTNGFKIQTGLDVTIQPGRYHIVHVLSNAEINTTGWSYSLRNVVYVLSGSTNRYNIFIRTTAATPLDPISFAVNAFDRIGIITPILLKWTYV